MENGNRKNIFKLAVSLFTLAGIFIAFGVLLETSPPEYKERILPKKQTAALIRLHDTTPEGITAEAILVKRIKTGEVLFAKNQTQRFATASLSKLITAFLFEETIDPLVPVVMLPEAKELLESDEKRSDVPVGEYIKAEDLLKLLIVESDNDAAFIAAAKTVFQRYPEMASASFAQRADTFVRLMNETAKAYGFGDTAFSNPIGRDAPDNFSTAEDLDRLAEVIYQRKESSLWNLSRLLEGEIVSTSGAKYHFKNTNVLLQEFPAIYGSKTGFTDEAGGALLMLYELAPRDPIVIVILKSQNRFEDGRRILRWLDASFRVTED